MGASWELDTIAAEIAEAAVSPERWMPGDDLWVVSIQRSAKQGPFDDRERTQLGRIHRHLNVAATVTRELSLARARGLADAFEFLGTPALITDDCGQIISANNAAEETLTSDLHIAGGRLIAVQHSTTKRIKDLIENAASAPAGKAVGGPVVVARPGKRPLVVYAASLPGEVDKLVSRARAIVIVRDLDEQNVPTPEQFRQVFGLTLAEAKLAERLAAGDSVTLAAETLRISGETARTQLKAIFSKTGSSRQAELIGLLLRLLANGRG